MEEHSPVFPNFSSKDANEEKQNTNEIIDNDTKQPGRQAQHMNLNTV